MKWNRTESYSINELVYYDGNQYVSLKDNNTDRPTRTSSWRRVDLVNLPTKNPTGLPVGTIIDLPKGVLPLGFIPLESGKRFDGFVYKPLYDVLGTDVFPTVEPKSDIEELPVGTMLTVLSEDNVPKGWKVWKSQVGNLANTRLLDVFHEVATNLTGESRQVWDRAIREETFPRLPDDFFLRVIQSGSLKNIGEYFKDTTVLTTSGSFNLPTVVQLPNKSEPHIQESKLQQYLLSGSFNSDDPLVKMGTVIYGDDEVGYHKLSGKRFTDLKDISIGVSPIDREKVGDEVTPKSVAIKLIVKVDPVEVTKGNTHKAIKAYDTLDVPEADVTLRLDRLLEVHYQYRDIAEDIKSELERTKEEYKEEANNTKEQYTTTLAEFLTTLKSNTESSLSSLVQEELNKVKEKDNTFLEEQKAKLEEAINKLKCCITCTENELADKYAETINVYREILLRFPDLQSDIGNIEEVKEKIKDTIENARERITTETVEKVTELETQVNQINSTTQSTLLDYAKLINDNSVKVDDFTNDITTKFSYYKDTVDHDVQEFKNNANNTIEEFKNSTNTTISEFKNSTNERIDSKFREHTANVEEKINSAKSDLNDKINQLNTTKADRGEFREFKSEVRESIQTKVNTALAPLNALESRVQINEATLESLINADSSFGSKLTNIEAQLSRNALDTSTLRDSFNQFTSTTTTSIPQLQTSIQENTKNVTELKPKVDQNTRDIQSIKLSLGSIIPEELSQGVETNKQTLATLQQSVQQNTANVTGLDTRVGTLESEVATLKQADTAINASIEAINSKLLPIDKTLNTNETDSISTKYLGDKEYYLGKPEKFIKIADGLYIPVYRGED